MRPPRPVLFLLVVVLVSIAVAARPAPPLPESSTKPTVHDLAWMSGRWLAAGDGEFLEESWGPVAVDGLVGTFRWAREGKTFMYELMTVEQGEAGELTFTLRHFGRGLEPWEGEKAGGIPYTLVEFGEQRVVFENAESSDMRQFVYAREGDVLAISLVRPGADGEPDFEHAESFELELAR